MFPGVLNPPLVNQNSPAPGDHDPNKNEKNESNFIRVLDPRFKVQDPTKTLLQILNLESWIQDPNKILFVFIRVMVPRSW